MQHPNVRACKLIHGHEACFVLPSRLSDFLLHVIKNFFAETTRHDQSHNVPFIAEAVSSPFRALCLRAPERCAVDWAADTSDPAHSVGSSARCVFRPDGLATTETERSGDAQVGLIAERLESHYRCDDDCVVLVSTTGDGLQQEETRAALDEVLLDGVTH